MSIIQLKKPHNDEIIEEIVSDRILVNVNQREEYLDKHQKKKKHNKKIFYDSKNLSIEKPQVDENVKLERSIKKLKQKDEEKLKVLKDMRSIEDEEHENQSPKKKKFQKDRTKTRVNHANLILKKNGKNVLGDMSSNDIKLFIMDYCDNLKAEKKIMLDKRYHKSEAFSHIAQIDFNNIDSSSDEIEIPLSENLHMKELEHYLENLVNNTDKIIARYQEDGINILYNLLDQIQKRYLRLSNCVNENSFLMKSEILNSFESNQIINLIIPKEQSLFHDICEIIYSIKYLTNNHGKLACITTSKMKTLISAALISENFDESFSGSLIDVYTSYWKQTNNENSQFDFYSLSMFLHELANSVNNDKDLLKRYGYIILDLTEYPSEAYIMTILVAINYYLNNHNNLKVILISSQNDENANNLRVYFKNYTFGTLNLVNDLNSKYANQIEYIDISNHINDYINDLSQLVNKIIADEQLENDTILIYQSRAKYFSLSRWVPFYP